MKKQLLILSILLLGSVSYLKAQIYTPAGMIQGASGSNNVGIGTNNPVSKLDIAGDAHIKVADDKSGIGGLTIDTNGGTTLKMGGNFTYSWIQSHMSLPLYINELGNNTVFNLVAGNVGIGTSTPAAKLSVVGGISKLTESGTDGVFDNLIKYGYKGDLESGTNYANRWHGIDATITAGGAEYNKLKFKMYSGGTGNLVPVDVMTIVGNGRVGIGTTNPDSKLTVAGNVHAQEVKVTVNAGAVPDYVFANDYKLKSLEEVETYIKQHSHLPEIPSAKEIEKNGLMLAEMNLSLLKKIEEMTLYMIEMKNENELLRKHQVELEKRILNVENKKI